MSAEDRLRDILKNRASTVVPTGDGLALIRERVARRRRLRMLAVPAGALVTAAAVVAVFALIGQPSTQQVVGPAEPSPPTATGTEPTPGEIVTGTPDTLEPVPAAPYRGPALWPFTSAEQGLAWTAHHGARPWADNPVAVAQHFIDDLLSLSSVITSGTAPDVALKVQGRPVGVVHVVRTFEDGPWTVVGVDGTDLSITTPRPGDAITSPTRVSGRITGVDENVQLQLITATGHLLATGGAPAGTDMPWNGALTWSDQTWFTAGIVGVTRSSKDGSITRIAVIPVKRSAA